MTSLIKVQRTTWIKKCCHLSPPTLKSSKSIDHTKATKEAPPPPPPAPQKKNASAPKLSAITTEMEPLNDLNFQI